MKTIRLDSVSASSHFNFMVLMDGTIVESAKVKKMKIKNDDRSIRLKPGAFFLFYSISYKTFRIA